MTPAVIEPEMSCCRQGINMKVWPHCGMIFRSYLCFAMIQRPRVDAEMANSTKAFGY
jgi:hypothetical protein